MQGTISISVRMGNAYEKDPNRLYRDIENSCKTSHMLSMVKLVENTESKFEAGIIQKS